MYHFVENKEFLKLMRRECSDLINQLVTLINNEGELVVQANLVGSGARHLETQDNNGPIDLDYNLVILKSNNLNINDGRKLKKFIKERFDFVLTKNGWHNSQDSKSALSTEKRYFPEFEEISFSIDLAIIKLMGSSWYRLIHEKTGVVANDKWFWNEGPHSNGLNERVDWLKNHNLWESSKNVKGVRETYLDKKNMYLTCNDENHSSFNCYIEAVNEVYFRYNH